jgi:hypothetical protein
LAQEMEPTTLVRLVGQDRTGHASLDRHWCVTFVSHQGEAHTKPLMSRLLTSLKLRRDPERGEVGEKLPEADHDDEEEEEVPGARRGMSRRWSFTNVFTRVRVGG